MKKTSYPIWFDIETGGVDPSQSSILSIATKQGDNLRSSFIRPEAGSFLSAFSEHQILPQLKGRKLISEAQSISNFITQLSSDPEAPIAGFNIRGFDIGFIQQRARIHGLEGRFTQAMAGRQIIDPIFQVKDIIASSVMQHTLSGLYQEDLEGRTWEQAREAFRKTPFKERPPQYNLLAQIEGYLKKNDSAAMFKGWKLEDINSILTQVGGEEVIEGAAHEAATDILMTQRVTEAAKSGKLKQVFSTPEAGRKWMDIVSKRGFYQLGPSSQQLVSMGPELGKGPIFEGGRILSTEEVAQISPTLKTRIVSTIKNHPGKVALGAAAVILAGAYFSGRDDNYNTIEGLGHKGIAHLKRKDLTEFGSGYTAKAIRELAELSTEVPKKNFLELLQVKEVDNSFLSMIGGGMNIDWDLSKKMMSFIPSEHHEMVDFTMGIIRKEGFSSGAYVTTTAADDISKFLKEQLQIELPRPSSMEEVSKVIGFHEATELRNMRAMSPQKIVEFQGQGIMPHHHMAVVQEEMFLRSMSSDTRGFFRAIRKEADPWFSGFDDKYNTIEGLRHGGLSEELRHILTSFGSGWKGLRNLLQDTETIQDVIKSSTPQPRTNSARKLSRAALQRQASAAAWNNGVNGGRRSRM